MYDRIREIMNSTAETGRDYIRANASEKLCLKGTSGIDLHNFILKISLQGPDIDSRDEVLLIAPKRENKPHCKAPVNALLSGAQTSIYYQFATIKTQRIANIYVAVLCCCQNK
jgi:hypothetical protein